MTQELLLTPDDVNELVSILDGSGYDRLDIQTARFRLRVARDQAGWTQEWDLTDAHHAPVAIATMQDDPSAALPDGLVAVVAPLPGTFYRAPSPGAPPYIQEGDEVGPDTVVGIIETMKLMNPVHAGVTGVVVAVTVDNAVMIDGGALLLHVRPA